MLSPHLHILFLCCGCFSHSTLTTNSSSNVSDKEPIYILTLLPYYNPEPSLNPSFTIGDDVQPAMELAKMQINDNQSMLENYTLQLVHAQGGCEFLTTTSTSFVEETFRPDGRRLRGIIGPGCSSSTIFIAPITNRSELGIVMIHGTGSPTLSDRREYRYLLSTLGSTTAFVETFRSLLNATNWKRVSILYDNANVYYESTKSLLVDELGDHTDVSIAAISFDFFSLDAILQARTPIVFVLAPLELTQRLLCLARNKTMIFPTFQWVLMDNRLEELIQPVNSNFIYSNTNYSCSQEDISAALEKSFLMSFDLEESDETLLVSNMTFDEYRDAYSERRQQYNSEMKPARNSTYSFWAGIFYDAVWAWGLVLDNLTKSMEDFDAVGDSGYGNLDQSEVIVQQLYQTSFQGASGKMNFDKEIGFTQRDVDLFQVINGSQIPLSLPEVNESELIIISDSFQNQTVRIHRWIGFIFGIISVFEVIIVVMLHVATVVFRNKPSVKASSPNLLHISYVGVYVVFLGFFFLFVYIATPFPVIFRGYLCIVFWTWCLPIGYTLGFGPVAMRTWRLYRIFKHVHPGPLLKDRNLIIGVGILLAVDLVTGLLWTVLDPFGIDYIVEDPNRLPIIFVTVRCSSQLSLVFFILTYAYKLILLLIVTVFNVLTRKISYPSFSTRTQRILVYLFASIFVFGFGLYYTILFTVFNPNYSAVVLSSISIMLLTVFIVCIFIPPFIPILKSINQQKQQKVTQNTVNIDNTAFSHI